MCSLILHKAKDRAIGLKEVVELALGIRITLKTVHVHEWGNLLMKIILLRTLTMAREKGVGANGVETLSEPEAGDLREAIEVFNTLTILILERT